MRMIRSNEAYQEKKTYIKNLPDTLTLKKFVYHVAYPFLNIFYKLLIHTIKPKSNNGKYNIVFCTIFKNEARFFKEWISYHNMIGVDHFYLYNNNSTDNYKEVLQPFVDKGIVTIIDWPQIPGQFTAYKHWYDNYRRDCNWCSFLDLDEFICPKYDYNIKSWLKKFSKYPVIKIDWLMFGTSTILEHDDNKPVIEQYTHCWNKKGRIGKELYNCYYDIAYFNNTMHHVLSVKYKGIVIPPFNDSGNICINYTTQRYGSNSGSIQINHYYSRAYDILSQKLTKGDSAFIVGNKDSQPYWQREMNCSSVDYTIQRFLLQLKIVLNNKEIL